MFKEKGNWHGHNFIHTNGYETNSRTTGMNKIHIKVTLSYKSLDSEDDFVVRR